MLSEQKLGFLDKFPFFHSYKEIGYLQDFESERKWKLAQAKKVALRASKGMIDQATREERKLKVLTSIWLEIFLLVFKQNNYGLEWTKTLGSCLIVFLNLSETCFVNWFLKLFSITFKLRIVC